MAFLFGQPSEDLFFVAEYGDKTGPCEREDGADRVAGRDFN